jgi:5-methylcytosine-specific restriction enzyme A
MSGALPIEDDGLRDLDETPPGNLVPDRAVVSGMRVIRSQKVREHVIRGAKGQCEFCGKHGFQMKDGRRYLEAHHIILLSSDGSDTVDNVIALCADHHRQAHYGADAEALEQKFIECIKRRPTRPNKALEPTPSSVTPRAVARVAPTAVVAHL